MCRVLHLSTPRSWRGGEQQAFYLHRELNHKPNLAEASLLICPTESSLYRRCRTAGLPVEGFDNLHPFNLIAARRLKRSAEAFRAEVIHLHDAHALNLAVLAVSLFGLKLPLVFSRRTDFPLKKNAFTRFKYNHPQLKKIVAVSRRIAEVIAPDIDRHERIEVVHSGIDRRRFLREESARGRLHELVDVGETVRLIGNASAFSPHKDLSTFVETARVLVEKSYRRIHFVLLGDGETRSEVERLIQSYRLADTITLLGWRDDVARLLPDLSVFLMTSNEEGLGTTVLDAMAARVPVVATRAGGLPESVHHERTGLLAPIGDADELAHQVGRLLDDRELAERLKIRAADLVEREFSAERTAERTAAIYRKIVKNNSVEN